VAMHVIRKIGQSKGIIIPKAYLDSLGLAEGTFVDIRVIDDQIVVKQARRKYTLEELVSQMQTEHNIPELIQGEVGEEILEYNNNTETSNNEPEKNSRTR
jgi:antitoxin MazE